ncbi:hypothetical protein AVEN_96137-1 [Araneus ventricosus]|uniref:Uncharacterized protein n=1 Tax=Araneus ventricosus TaxID=182803 RepID=A0A4Y2VAU3_ARAVE|nr:hypothetical protein AVEN_96137-1 [Araneus ventricosus]
MASIHHRLPCNCFSHNSLRFFWPKAGTVTWRIVGTYGLVLQKLIEDGHLRVSDSLVDVNNMPTEIVLLFDVSYNAPDGSVGEWSTSAMQGESFEDDRQALIVIEHNIANLERSINNRQQQQQAAQEVDYHLPPRNSGSALSLVSPRSPERKRCVTNTRQAHFTSYHPSTHTP